MTDPEDYTVIFDDDVLEVKRNLGEQIDDVPNQGIVNNLNVSVTD